MNRKTVNLGRSLASAFLSSLSQVEPPDAAAVQLQEIAEIRVPSQRRKRRSEFELDFGGKRLQSVWRPQRSCSHDSHELCARVTTIDFKSCALEVVQSAMFINTCRARPLENRHWPTANDEGKALCSEAARP